VPEDPREAAIAVADAIWAEAPRHIALILDDAHEVTTGSAGAEFLAMLVEELPLNGHLVIAARPELKLEVSRLRGDGRVGEVQQNDLLFIAPELGEFAELRGVPVELLESWPVLAELRATVGVEAVISYLWAELLAQFSRERRKALGVLAAIGGADEEMARELLGPDVRLDEVLEGLPLVVRAANGWRSLHATWADTLRHQLDAGEVADVWRRAGLVLRRRRQYHEAMNLLLKAEAWDDVRSLITEVCEVCTPLVPTDVLEDWQRRLPQDMQAIPEGILLAAMVAEPTDPVVAERLLEQALELAPTASPVRYACLNALIQLAFWRSDRTRIKRIVGQLAEFPEEDHPEAHGWIAVLKAFLALDPAAVEEELADPTLLLHKAHNPIQDWLHAHVVLLKLGDAARAEPLAMKALAHDVSTMEAVSRSALAESLRLRGLLAEAAEKVPALVSDLKPTKVLTSPELVTQTVVLLDILGRPDDATAVLERSMPVVARSPVAWAPIARVVASAFHAVSTGEEDTARDLVRALTELPVVRNEAALIQVSASALPLVYVLADDLRESWDQNPQPGCFAPMHELARALVDLRERSSTERLVALDPEARRLIRATMPIPWLTEMAVGLVACGVDDGRVLLEELGNLARPTLRQQLGSKHKGVATAARSLLREMPAVPAYTLQLRVLGNLSLARDGVAITPPELRRERVRQLLGYLVTHQRTTRHAVTAELWPDLDETAGARNLRVTLAYLQNVLEPDRGELDPPYFVRSSGPVLELFVDPALEVDAISFTQHLERAEQLEQQGALSAALEEYVQATDLWTGEYLADVSLGDWVEHERDRMRYQFVHAAIRAGNLFLARGDTTMAVSLAERALQHDAWSETAYQLLIAVHLELGDRISSRRYLERCRVMLRELNTRPDPQTVTLARKLAASV
jgi:DNA-binding SARP family transcriptional activator